MATKYSLALYQGATFSERYEFLDANGLPLDFNGYEARMHIRPTKESSTVYCRLSSSIDVDGTGINLTPISSSVTLPKSSGSLSVYISAASSSAFTWIDGFYDLEIYSGSGASEYVYRLLEGKVRNSRNVTR